VAQRRLIALGARPAAKPHALTGARAGELTVFPESWLSFSLGLISSDMRLSHRCYALTGLAYLPPWSVNAGFIVGSETTLIVDTGACALAAATIHGYAGAVRGGNRMQVIDLERHFDHIGGNSYFRERGIDVYGHVRLHRTEDEFRAEVEGFNGAIPNAARQSRREAEVFFAGTRFGNPNRAISSDTEMHLGDCVVEIILTPGHTPTNLSVWAPEDGVLYCADCLTNGYLPNLDAGTVADWHAWTRSIDRIERLKPAVIVPGHGPVAMGADVDRVIESARGVLGKAIADGFSPTSRRAAAG
jgi:glyoxylase-like metal-dependent hydrolase (beta-lactamase superfamily II)